VLPLEPVTDAALAAQAARVLYRLWWQEADSSTEAQKLEIHRLALAGKVGDVAAKIAGNFLRLAWNKSRFREVTRLCVNRLSSLRIAGVSHQLAKA
jgi:hypothetical protein